ncbi:MAG: iron-containing alcohol dehydrogenase [Gammaproteobacteria bacterium]
MSGGELRGDWSYPNAVRFGAGRIAELPDACIAAEIRRPLLITDRGLMRLPVADRVLDILAAAGLRAGAFAEVDANPSDINLAAGVAAFCEGGYDGVIAFGGGSGLDLGKLVAFMRGQTRPVWDFEDVGDWWRRADVSAIAPIVAVPTTAGTGSEVGRAGVLLDSQNAVKKIIFHPQMLPAAVICDPELTVGMPPHITAGTGMDAFIHCLEAYCAPSFHPMSRGIALEGMRVALAYLPRAFADGNDLTARAQMMSAAAMGAVAFQKGLGAAHALSHPLGALYKTHHGMTNAVVLPAVLRFNRPVIETEIAAAAAYCGIDGGFDGFYARVMETRRALRVPDSLRELGADDDRLDELAAMAVKDPSAAGNPVCLTAESARRLLSESM